MDILGLFDGLFSAFGVNKKIDSDDIENEPIENNQSAYKQEVYKRKKELDESRSLDNPEQAFNKDL